MHHVLQNCSKGLSGKWWEKSVRWLISPFPAAHWAQNNSQLAVSAKKKDVSATCLYLCFCWWSCTRGSFQKLPVNKWKRLEWNYLIKGALSHSTIPGVLRMLSVTFAMVVHRGPKCGKDSIGKSRSLPCAEAEWSYRRHQHQKHVKHFPKSQNQLHSCFHKQGRKGACYPEAAAPSPSPEPGLAALLKFRQMLSWPQFAAGFAIQMILGQILVCIMTVRWIRLPFLLWSTCCSIQCFWFGFSLQMEDTYFYFSVASSC